MTQKQHINLRKYGFALENYITMSSTRQEKTEISSDGLRYKSKKGGSPFEGLGRTGDTMSCIKCGVHKPRSNGSFKRILGSSMFVCFDCSPKKEPAKDEAVKA
jgi:hypothetical protein